jgi:MoaA/NifB/PqqE/SkfB family radical SAM enzyme
MLSNTFCSSPWIHLRVLPNGNYNTCRWAANKNVSQNIKQISLHEFYNGTDMSELRNELLDGKTPSICTSCQYEDKHGKLSGRRKQLLKSAVTETDFDLKMRASPHYKHFKYSWENAGKSDYHPVDLQIDLGNICNSACIMCSPMYSSRLESDYDKLSLLADDLFENPTHNKSWTRNPELIDKFVEEIGQIPNLNYIHFLGGETLYDAAFYKICDKLIEKNLAKDIIVGTTTNATIYNEKIETYIKSFRQFHLGISIESVTNLNDYIRYPSKIESVLDIINKFSTLRKDNRLFLSLRITPNIFTIYEFDKLARYMIEYNISAESCNILNRPSVLRMELMPNDIRQETVERLKAVINEYKLTKNSNLINTRSNKTVDQNIANTIIEYYDFILNYSIPDNAEKERKNLIRFLNSFEHLRNNRITDYAPRYTEFLRNYGYGDKKQATD